MIGRNKPTAHPPPLPVGSRLPSARPPGMAPRGGRLPSVHPASMPGAEADLAPTRPRRARVGELLVASGKASSNDVISAVFEQRRNPGRRLGEILIERGVITEVELTGALAREFQLSVVDLTKTPPQPAAIAAVPPSIILKHRVLPVDVRGNTLVLAVRDPLDFEAIEAVRFNNSFRQVTTVLVVPSQLDAAIALLTRPGRALPRAAPSGVDAILREIVQTEAVQSEAAEGQVANVNEEHSAVIRLVNQILADAHQKGASDIHVEPTGPGEPVMVRFRIDGDCSTYQRLPRGLAGPVVARIKIMASLDIAERRKPQDGKIRFGVGETLMEFRVATLPTAQGSENVVLRLLPPSKPRQLGQMSLSPRNLRELTTLLAAPYGLVLCVGPTGSGKTTTLHSALAQLNKPDVKIWTVEDPVEITQPGLCQVQVNRKAGLDFATAMRAFLRADPDIIMIGEMRDKETAATAIEASLTGHLVLSTLHTNNAPETVVRLLDMGLDRFSFADSLLGILSQRLVRALCNDCKEPCALPEVDRELMARAFGGHDALELAFGAEQPSDLHAWRSRGCEACGGAGYRGRVPIHELLVSDDALRSSIARSTSIEAIREIAVSGGMTTLLQDGIAKSLSGDTDMHQVLGACSR